MSTSQQGKIWTLILVLECPSVDKMKGMGWEILIGKFTSRVSISLILTLVFYCLISKFWSIEIILKLQYLIFTWSMFTDPQIWFLKHQLTKMTETSKQNFKEFHHLRNGKWNRFLVYLLQLMKKYSGCLEKKKTNHVFSLLSYICWNKLNFVMQC